MLDVQGLRSMQRSLTEAKKKAEGGVTKAYQKFVGEVFEDLVMHTPQWSGNLAVNWQIRLTNDGPATAVPWFKKGHTGGFMDNTFKSVQIGDGEAAMYAMEHAVDQISKMHWNTKVRFENPVDYAMQVNEGEGPEGKELRPQHLPPFDMMMYYVVAKYSRGETLLWSSDS